jgi:hypothetical protein
LIGLYFALAKYRSEDWMRFRSIGRVVVFSVCLGTLASAHAPFAESVHFFLKPGKTTKLKSVTGGWPARSVINEAIGGDWLQKKQLGKPKFEDISCSVDVGDLDEELTDWFNATIAGQRDFRGGGLILHEQSGVTRASFMDATPTKIVLPAFDSIEKTCTDWRFSISPTTVGGTPWLMKAKEKANRTKCSSNLRMIFSNDGKETGFDVWSTEEVQTIILEADLDGDGDLEPLGMNIGNVTIRLRDVHAGYFRDWMRRSGENPLYETKGGHLRIRTDKQGDIDNWFDGMLPVSVTEMGDGSVRIEMIATNLRVRARP